MTPRPLIGVVASAIVGGAVFLLVDRLTVESPWFVMPRQGPMSLEVTRRAVDRAKGLMREGQYDEARFELAQLRYHDLRHLTTEIASALAECDIELAAARHVTRAGELMSAERYAEARAELYRVAPGTRAVVDKGAREIELARVSARLMEEAEILRPHRTDRKQMARLKRVGELLAEIEPNLAAASELTEEAGVALEELDAPARVAKRLFDQGDLSGALKKARECAIAGFPDCRELQVPLTTFAAAWPKLKTLSTAKLNELYQLTVELSDDEGVLVKQLGDLIASRYEAVARKCRSAGDWSCVDRQISLADGLGHAFDESIQGALDAFAKDTALHAYQLRGHDPKSAGGLIKEVLELENVDPRWRSLAQRLEQRR